MVYEMMFVKDFGAYRKGEVAKDCSRPVAEKLMAAGVAVEADKAVDEPKKAKAKKSTRKKK